jgi:hypothetical protein
MGSVCIAYALHAYARMAGRALSATGESIVANAMMITTGRPTQSIGSVRQGEARPAG